MAKGSRSWNGSPSDGCGGVSVGLLLNRPVESKTSAVAETVVTIQIQRGLPGCHCDIEACEDLLKYLACIREEGGFHHRPHNQQQDSTQINICRDTPASSETQALFAQALLNSQGLQLGFFDK